MKTKNNVQKTILRTVAVIVSFVLISFTVSAQDFWKKLLTNSSFNEIAIAMTENSDKSEAHSEEASTTKSLNTYYFEEAQDASLELEDWMTNDSYFMNSIFQPEIENALELEDWMYNESIFNTQNETEETMVLESWMTEAAYWKI